MAITSGVSWKDTKSPVIGASPCPFEPLVEHRAPGGRGRRPDDRARSLGVLVPAGRQQLGGAAGRLGLHAGEHALVADLGVVALVEVLGQAREEVELLRATRTGRRRCSRRGRSRSGTGVGSASSRRSRPATRPRPRSEHQGGAERSGAGHVVTSLQSVCRAAMTPGLSVGCEIVLGGARPAVVDEGISRSIDVREVVVAVERRRCDDGGVTRRRPGAIDLHAPLFDLVGHRLRRRRRPSRCPAGWPACGPGRGRRAPTASARVASQPSNSPAKSLAAKSVPPKKPAAAEASTLSPVAESGSVSPTFSSRPPRIACPEVAPVLAGVVAEAAPHVVAVAQVGDGVEAAGRGGDHGGGGGERPAVAEGVRACGCRPPRPTPWW